ncbi:MAG: hypothetical protein A2831_03100 [Candidatus Yanofskybacteria bacterium RIFCSPHIGHO2_01_FULL_44_17]|uniref:Reverse transcriptase domain-containing protein n=1 Tax=Candidatus Yanofskybacteria bacterium RIFCSPHIGHO2_01_FULL_44_17 TaxID=1802668 RepID=A0A1F8EV11_9BACT|nr:MAG: hypothetical protein A2831_03100 [Candidatus Yanofskybacteria bacterium RIFCSPHIGHO2_01_FULL_44_17]
MKTYNNIFYKIIELENLFWAWDGFKKDKQNRKDVQIFEWKLEENIFQLHRDLKNKKYKHGPYKSFFIQDPKQRHIHKATVRDRVLHHAIFSVVNPLFEETFIANSFSCRIGKGTHRGIISLNKTLGMIGKTGFEKCWALKSDIKKFFQTVDHQILLGIIRKRIKDADAMWLLQEIIGSFLSEKSDIFYNRGLPIGNLTSQLFANIYLNELDQFVKNKLKVKHYWRYTDDFIIASENHGYLKERLSLVSNFLANNLKLELHPNKMTIRKFQQGIDFLGYVTLPHHQTLRTKTKKRIFRKLKKRIVEYKSDLITRKTLDQSLQSYLGVLTHADAYKLSEQLKNQFWFWLNE